MAGRRCLSSKITESDPFYALPESAQALYLHLNMQADDDGFLNNAASVSIRFKGGAAALKKLVEKRFLLKFEDVYVIKHWRISNSLKNDRLKPLSYASISQRIWVKGNKAYTDHPVPGCKTLYEVRTGAKPQEVWIPNGFPTEANPTKPKSMEPKETEQEELRRVFREIYERYPQGKAGNPEAAEAAFRQVIRSLEDGFRMWENLKGWLQSEQWNKENGKYIPYFSNWILRGTWQDLPARMAVPKGASGELGEAELEAIRRVLAQPEEDFSMDDIGYGSRI